MLIKVFVVQYAEMENMNQKDLKSVTMEINLIKMAAQLIAKLRQDILVLRWKAKFLLVLLFVEMEKLIKMKFVTILLQVGILQLVEISVQLSCQALPPRSKESFNN